MCPTGTSITNSIVDSDTGSVRKHIGIINIIIAMIRPVLFFVLLDHTIGQENYFVHVRNWDWTTMYVTLTPVHVHGYPDTLT